METIKNLVWTIVVIVGIIITLAILIPASQFVCGFIPESAWPMIINIWFAIGCISAFGGVFYIVSDIRESKH